MIITYDDGKEKQQAICNLKGLPMPPQILCKYCKVRKGKRADVYLEVKKRRNIFFE